jgi:hypothetical protein
MLAAQAVIDAEAPAFEVGEKAMHPRQQQVGGRRADDLGMVFTSLSLADQPSLTTVAPGATAAATKRSDCRRVVRDGPQPGAAGAIPGDLDGAGDHQLAAVAEPRRSVSGSSLVRYETPVSSASTSPVKGLPFGREHRPTELGAQPGGLVSAAPRSRFCGWPSTRPPKPAWSGGASSRVTPQPVFHTISRRAGWSGIRGRGN